MSEKIIVPALGESISEATVSKWLKNTGESVEMDEPIVELETDKVNLEVPSPINGILGTINAKDGQKVEVGFVLGVINNNGSKKEISEATKFHKTESLPKDTENIINEAEKTIKNQSKVVELNISKNDNSPRIFDEPEEEVKTKDDTLLLTEDAEEIKKPYQKSLSPAVRKIVSEKNINIDQVSGSGKDGRILKSDLIEKMNIKPKPSKRKIEYGKEEKIKMTRLRQTIAKRLKEAQENAAILTTFNEVDMTEILEMREENQDDFQNRFGVKLGIMSFFVKACVIGLKNFPMLNAEIEGDQIIYKNYYNISFAVGTDKGLVVPVLHNADELSFAEIEKNIKTISEKARNGKLTIEDLQGGTFTISNGGVYGSMLSTPILNPPQSGVLGMHNIVKRPIVVEDEIKKRSVMYLALSYDHRIIDGKDSVSFLKTVKENLEDPRRLFLNI